MPVSLTSTFEFDNNVILIPYLLIVLLEVSEFIIFELFWEYDKSKFKENTIDNNILQNTTKPIIMFFYFSL